MNGRWGTEGRVMGYAGAGSGAGEILWFVSEKGGMVEILDERVRAGGELKHGC